MTLNRSFFPELPVPSVYLDFCTAPPRTGPDDTGQVHGGMDVYVAVLDRFLRDHPTWTSADRRIVVAHSFGAMLALQWLVEGQRQGSGAERSIEGLLVIGSTCGPMFDAARIRMASLGGRELRLPVAPFIGIWNRPWVTRTAKRMFTGGSLSVRRVDFQLLTNRSDAAVDRAGWHNTDWRAMRAFRCAMQGFDVRDDLAGLSIPSIVLHGEYDSLFPVSVGRELAHRLDAEFRVVPDAGHALPLTHPDAVLSAVRALVDSDRS